MTIAQQIYRGASAADIGLTVDQYASRHEVLQRFLSSAPPLVDFDAEYIAWLATDAAGSRQQSRVDTTGASRGLGDTIAKITSAVGITPCGGCKKRQALLNRIIPYKAKT